MLCFGHHKLDMFFLHATSWTDWWQDAFTAAEGSLHQCSRLQNIMAILLETLWVPHICLHMAILGLHLTFYCINCWMSMFSLPTNHLKAHAVTPLGMNEAASLCLLPHLIALRTGLFPDTWPLCLKTFQEARNKSPHPQLFWLKKSTCF